MAFNHYAKLKRILEQQPAGWYIVRINQSTEAKNFKGEVVHYDHFYRIYDVHDQPIPYCKFQKLDKFLNTLGLREEEVPILEKT